MNCLDPPEFYIGDIEDETPKFNCKFFSPHDLPQSNDNDFSLFNRRQNFSALLSFFVTYCLNFSLIILTETWLTANIDNGFNIGGYNQYNVYRSSHGAGLKYTVVSRLNQRLCKIIHILMIFLKC